MSEKQPFSRIIYHIATRDDWRQYANNGLGYAGSDNDLKSGFIHLSTAQQVTKRISSRRFGAKDLLLLTVDAQKLGDLLRWERSSDGDLYPHLYGRLPSDTIIKIESLPIGPDGLHVLPDLQPEARDNQDKE